MAAALALCMVALGMGNGAAFQIVPQRFRSQIGTATGIVGALGGLGGFVLPTLLGTLKQTTGSFGAGFLVLALVALAAAVALRSLASTREGWPAPLGAGGAGAEA
jgi:NNP family nitrate/nitrite transporter-like MFS transporter